MIEEELRNVFYQEYKRAINDILQQNDFIRPNLSEAAAIDPHRSVFTASEIIALYGISSRTLINWQHNGLRFQRVGRKKYYTKKEMDRFILAKSNEY